MPEGEEGEVRVESGHLRMPRGEEGYRLSLAGAFPLRVRVGEGPRLLPDPDLPVVARHESFASAGNRPFRGWILGEEGAIWATVVQGASPLRVEVDAPMDDPSAEGVERLRQGGEIHAETAGGTLLLRREGGEELLLRLVPAGRWSAMPAAGAPPRFEGVSGAPDDVETGGASPDGSGEVPARWLVVESLRGRPHRGESVAARLLRPLGDLRYGREEAIGIRIEATTEPLPWDRALLSLLLAEGEERDVGRAALSAGMPALAERVLLRAVGSRDEESGREAASAPPRPSAEEDPATLLLAAEWYRARGTLAGAPYPADLLLATLEGLPPELRRRPPYRAALLSAADALEGWIGRERADALRRRPLPAPGSEGGRSLPVLGGSGATGTGGRSRESAESSGDPGIDPVEAAWFGEVRSFAADPGRKRTRPTTSSAWVRLANALARGGDPESGWAALHSAFRHFREDPQEGAAFHAAALLALLEGTLGIRAEPAAGRIRVAPQLPGAISTFSLERIPAGADQEFDFSGERTGERWTFRFRPGRGSLPLSVIFEPTLPLKRIGTVLLEGEEVDPERTGGGERSGLRMQFPLDSGKTLIIE